jgi:hypothetical protein
MHTAKLPCMKRALALVSSIGLALAFAALPAAAQWKWKDGRGQVQYSDLPPPASVPQKDILQQPYSQSARVVPVAPAASEAAASAPAGVDPQLEAKRKQAEQQEAAKRQAEKKAEDDKVAALRADNCRKARSNLAMLQSGGRIQRMNEKGEREYIDDANISREIAAQQQIVNSDCR